MAETVAIARAVGCEPAVEIERRLSGAERVGEHKTSTLMDLEAGKPLELGAIVDAVVELADLTGTPAPHLKSVWAATGLLAQTLGLEEPR
jgi:2-dehydropantoate 2-reductase